MTVLRDCKNAESVVISKNKHFAVASSVMLSYIVTCFEDVLDLGLQLSHEVDVV
jgi:hypothetical protein